MFEGWIVDGIAFGIQAFFAVFAFAVFTFALLGILALFVSIFKNSDGEDEL